MKVLLKFTFFIFLLLVSFSCKDDDTSEPCRVLTDEPSEYNFNRGCEPSVDFLGQTRRSDMLAAIKSYLLLGDAGEIIEATTLREAFRNEADNGGGLFDFESSKQLENKLFGPDLDEDYFGDLFEQAAIASKNTLPASDGEPGLINRESKGTTILVNNRGHEFTQFIEKGLMGSVFLHQMLNVYLTDAFIGDAVDNVAEGTNYTDLEHHWDKAFGYFQAPGDFESNWPSDRAGELRFWSNYANIVDPSLGINSKIMDAFRDGRAAIVANDLSTKNNSRDILYTQLEILTAATTLHYINQSIDHLNAGDIGDLFHTLSEAYMFARALNMVPNRAILETELHNILNVDFGIGGNFWQVNADGLNTAKDKLVLAYPTLESVKDDL